MGETEQKIFRGQPNNIGDLFPPLFRHRLVHYLTPYQIPWTFCGWISGQCKCKWELFGPSLTADPHSLLPYNRKGFIFLMIKMISFTKRSKGMILSKNIALTYFQPHIPPFSPRMLPHLCPSYQSEHQWLLRPRPTHRNLLTSPCQRAPLRLNNQTISRLPWW